MFQVIFNEISAAEISQLPTTLQLEILTDFQVTPDDLKAMDPDRYGSMERDGKKLYRYRQRDYRIYFEVKPEGVVVHRVLHKNTFQDFLFRANLPMGDEDELLQKQKGFWRLIDEGKAARRA
ncbi:MAG: type II toxin-antitoxin system RelE/ParE family toxin [Verrucomicrobiales bacterium]